MMILKSPDGDQLWIQQILSGKFVQSSGNCNIYACMHLMCKVNYLLNDQSSVCVCVYVCVYIYTYIGSTGPQ